MNGWYISEINCSNEIKSFFFSLVIGNTSLYALGVSVLLKAFLRVKSILWNISPSFKNNLQNTLFLSHLLYRSQCTYLWKKKCLSCLIFFLLIDTWVFNKLWKSWKRLCSVLITLNLLFSAKRINWDQSLGWLIWVAYLFFAF